MFLCFQSVTGSKTRVSVFKQNTLHTCFVKTQVFKIKTPVFCQNTNTCFQSVTRRCFLTCLDSKHPLLQCTALSFLSDIFDIVCFILCPLCWGLVFWPFCQVCYQLSYCLVNKCPTTPKCTEVCAIVHRYHSL